MQLKKILKIGLISAASLLILAVAGVVVLVTVVNPNYFKPFITKAVYAASGRTITLAGDISWKIYPNLGLNIKQLSLSNPAGFEPKNMLQLASADVSVALIPLLSNHVVVKTLAIDGLQLALLEQNGQNNWTFTPPPTEPSAPGANSEAKPLRLELSSFSLTNSNFSYNSATTKQSLRLKDINFVVDTGFGGIIKYVAADDRIELAKVNFNYNDNAVGSLNFKVQNLANPHYAGDIQLTKFAVNKLLDQFAIAAKQRKGLTFLDNVTLSATVAGDKQNLNLKDFKFDFNNSIKGNLNLALKNLAKPSYSGNIKLEKLDLNKVLNSLNIALNQRKNKPLLNSLELKTSFSGDTNNLQLSALVLSAGELFKASSKNIAIANFANPALSGDITIPEFNLNKTLDGLGIALSQRKNKPLLDRFSYSSKFTASKNSASLKSFNFKAGGLIQGSGNVQLANFSQLNYSGNINLPSFSLNQVLQQLAIAIPDLANKNWLNQFSMNTTFAGGENKLNLTNLQLKAAATSLSGKIDFSSIQPLAFSENITIDQLDVADYSAVNGFRLPLRQIQLNGNSKMGSGGLASLTGQQNIQIQNITILGISLDKLIAQLDASIGHTGSNGGDIWRTLANSAQVIQAVNNMKKTMAAAAVSAKRDLSQTTNLGSFVSNMSFQNGIANPSSFKLSGPSVGLNGAGAVNLGQKKLNYKVNSQLLVAGINPLFKKLTFPALVQGSFSDPSAKLDWSSIQQQILAQAFETNKQQVKQAISGQLNQVIGNALGTKPNQAGSSNQPQPNQQPANKAVDALSNAATNVLGSIFAK